MFLGWMVFGVVLPIPMPEAKGPAPPGAARKRSGRGQSDGQAPTPSDPKKHAAELLEQANRLMRVAHRMRREAYRLNEALGVPVRRPNDRSRSSGRPARGEGKFAAAQGPHFGPGHKPSEVEANSRAAAADDLRISEGARLMITNMATLGNSREEILLHMRDELGI